MQSDLFTQFSALDFGDVHFKHDPETGMKAIIAIHNTNLGPALGGCRCVSYPDTQAALDDVLHLAHAMSYKAAMAGLPLGGGKAVILKPEHINDREALFAAYGRFVDELGGRYISSVDSGTGPADMDIASRYSQHIRSTTSHGDPSPSTAFGVRRGIEAAVLHHLGIDDLHKVHVLIQGAGHVGLPLAKELHNLGARLTICDRDERLAMQCADKFHARVVSPDEIYDIEADVFAPCALGGVINPDTIDRLKVKVVAGATNNPLSDDDMAQALHDKGILYAPDYVINAGGLMQVWIQDQDELRSKVSNIYHTLTELFAHAEKEHQLPAIMANHMAEKIIYGE